MGTSPKVVVWPAMLVVILGSSVEETSLVSDDTPAASTISVVLRTPLELTAEIVVEKLSEVVKVRELRSEIDVVSEISKPDVVTAEGSKIPPTEVDASKVRGVTEPSAVLLELVLVVVKKSEAVGSFSELPESNEAEVDVAVVVETYKLVVLMTNTELVVSIDSIELLRALLDSGGRSLVVDESAVSLAEEVVVASDGSASAVLLVIYASDDWKLTSELGIDEKSTKYELEEVETVTSVEE